MNIIASMSALLLAVYGQRAAPLLGQVGTTTTAGRVTVGVRNPYDLPVGRSIFGPFEAGFNTQQDFVLESLGCTSGSLGHVVGGIDTHMAEAMVAIQCDVELPRFDNGLRVSLLDDCGGHTFYHFHERLRCLYEDIGQHSPKLGEGNDGVPIYGKWEDAMSLQLPLLDACGGHYGTTPDSPTVPVYHYHVQDKAPFIIGCYGPNNDGSLVSVEQCRDLYPGCSGSSTRLSTGVDYELWCPCFDANGSNHGTAPLDVFTSGQATVTAPPSTTPPNGSPTPSSAVSATDATVVGEGYCDGGFSSGFRAASLPACEAACNRMTGCTYFAFCGDAACVGFNVNYCGLYTGDSCALTSVAGNGYTAYVGSSISTPSDPGPANPITPATPSSPPSRPTAPVVHPPRVPGRGGRGGRGGRRGA